MAQFNFEAIGTAWQIDIYQKTGEAEEAALFSEIKDRIELFDKAYSRFRGDSLVTEMSKQSGTFMMPSDAEPMLALYRDLYLRTDGFFTPLVGNLLSDAGYDAEYSLRQKKELEAPPSWDEVLEYKHPELTVKKPALLDFGAAGKGYLIDLVADVLETNGIVEFCINAGGDILHRNTASLRVGLENPKDTSQVIGVFMLGNGSICGSAGNRRAWENFTHIINPKTLASPKDIIAVWVVAETALVADALATCLFFVEAHTLADAYDFEYMLIREDYSIEKSDNFSGEMFVS